MLRILQAKQSVLTNSNYKGTITKLVITEFVPAVRAFKNKLQTIDENLFGAVAKGVVSPIGGAIVASIVWRPVLADSGTARGNSRCLRSTGNNQCTLRGARSETRLQHFLHSGSGLNSLKTGSLAARYAQLFLSLEGQASPGPKESWVENRISRSEYIFRLPLLPEATPSPLRASPGALCPVFPLPF